MFAHRSNRTRGWKIMAALAGLLALALILPGVAGAAQKKKKSGADPNANLAKRVNFDISKIVWPSPPEIARVKFVEQLTGEKIDFNRPINKPQKGKAELDGPVGRHEAAGGYGARSTLPTGSNVRAGF